MPEHLASRLESLWPSIASEIPKRPAPDRWVQSPWLAIATQLRKPEHRRSPGSSRTARPTIWPARTRQSSLRSAYYLLTSPNWFPKILCRSGNLCLVANLNGVQEVGSSNLPGPTNFPPVTHHFPILTIALHCDGLFRCPPNPCRLLIMCLFSVGPVPPGFSPLLGRTRQ